MIHTTVDSSVPGMIQETSRRSQQAPFVPCKRVSRRTVIWSMLLGIGLVIPAILFIMLFPVTRKFHEQMLAVALLPAILKHVFLGPLFEEVVYRGLFLQLGRRYLPSWIAIVVTSALFAAPHIFMGLGTALLAFPFGCLFAWMVIRTGSLIPGFLCHAAFNLTAFFVLVYAPNTLFPDPMTHLFPAWWIVASMVVVAMSFVMLTREFGRRKLAGLKSE